MSDSIIIANYNPNWPESFETLRARIATTLGLLAGAIEHVGSTAVPGLASKPIIDLDVLLRAPTDLPETITRLAALGYEHRGGLGIAGRDAFQCPPTDPLHHLYVCPPGSSAFREHIAFRDHLRTHFEDAKAYANLKRTLAAQHATDHEAYTQAKTDFVRHILGQAAADPTEHLSSRRRIIP